MVGFQSTSSGSVKLLEIMEARKKKPGQENTNKGKRIRTWARE